MKNKVYSILGRHPRFELVHSHLLQSKYRGWLQFIANFIERFTAIRRGILMNLYVHSAKINKSRMQTI